MKPTYASQNSPKISIIVPSYNQGKFLEKCLTSIFQQNYPNLEVFVIDGGSTDESISIIRNFEEKITYWHSKKDQGQCDAINQGVKKATGKLVTWLNSDDYYLSNAFFIMAQYYHQFPDASFYFGNGLRVTKNCDLIDKYFTSESPFFRRSEMIFSVNRVLQPATFINSAFLNTNNFLNENLHWGMDTDLWIRLSEHSQPIYVPEFIAASREYSDTKTSSGSFRRAEELRNIAETYSGLKMTPGSICYLLHTLHEEMNKYPNLYSNELQKDILSAWNRSKELLEMMNQNYSESPNSRFQPIVSIILECDIEKPNFETAFESIQSQTCDDYECIIVSNKPLADSEIFLKNHKDNDKIRWIHSENTNKANRLNMGVKNSKGNIVLCINVGDILTKDFIRTVISYFFMLPDIDMIYGETANTAGYLLGTKYTFHNLMLEKSRNKVWFAFRKHLIEDIGPFNEHLDYSELYDFWLRIGKANKKIHLLRDILIYNSVLNKSENIQTAFNESIEVFKVCKIHAGKIPLCYYYDYWNAKYNCSQSAFSLALKKLISPRISAQIHYTFRERKIFFSLYTLIKKMPGKLKNSNEMIINRHRLRIPDDKKGKELCLPSTYFKKKNLKIYPSISIVTPSFNQGEFIERTINSVLTQDYPNLEYIIQDGKSTDNTVSTIEKYEARLKHWESAEDNGQSHAINLGFRHASGEIMAYLNSDDLLLPGTLHYVAAYFDKHPEVDAIYGHRVLINENDYEIGRWVLPPHCKSILEWADFVPQETLFWRRSIWEKAGAAIDESFKFAMDWDLIMRFLDAGAKMKRLPRFLGAFRIHPQQKTLSFITETGYKEMNRIRTRIHKKDITDKDIHENTRLYFRDQAVYNLLYSLKNLFYKKKCNSQSSTFLR